MNIEEMGKWGEWRTSRAGDKRYRDCYATKELIQFYRDNFQEWRKLGLSLKVMQFKNVGEEPELPNLSESKPVREAPKEQVGNDDIPF